MSLLATVVTIDNPNRKQANLISSLNLQVTERTQSACTNVSLSPQSHYVLDQFIENCTFVDNIISWHKISVESVDHKIVVLFLCLKQLK